MDHSPDQPVPAADPSDPSTILLFDLDGTITDSFRGIEASFRHALATVGAPEPAPDIVAGIAGPPMLDTLSSLGLDTETTTSAMAAYRDRYMSVGWRENAVFAGMDDMLRDLHSAGRRMAVATSKNQTTARRILDHFSLSDLFDHIAGASDDGSRRTKSAVIASVLGELAVDDTHRLVMIGDRHHDVAGARAFGIPTVFVSWGYSRAGEAAAATWVVESVADLRELLGV